VVAHDAFPGLIQSGTIGSAVRAFQSKLAGQGWPLAVDGIDGPITTGTIRSFQAQKHLDADGVGGPLTWQAVLAAGTDAPAAPVPAPVAPAAPAKAVPPAPAPVVSAAASVAAPVRSALGGIWACIRQHESGGNYATNTGNGYYGAYQFALSTWRALGGAGLPSSASPAVQDAMAQKLQALAGWGQWPQTSKMCGV
jgi:hypothetical protein